MKYLAKAISQSLDFFISPLKGFGDFNFKGRVVDMAAVVGLEVGGEGVVTLTGNELSLGVDVRRLA